MPQIQKIRPFLWFDSQAREAAHFYCSVFPNSRILREVVLPSTPSGKVEIIDFELAGLRFQSMSAGPLYKFSEAISFVVSCDTQQEIDHFWSHLSAHPAAEACGWCKDPFGVSWQIVPAILPQLMSQSSPEALSRLMHVMLPMKKLEIAPLQQAVQTP
jgi:predicted 3-demethylubiquinone-9 3-methyltransferase (glyoxalase superfamily)